MSTGRLGPTHPGLQQDTTLSELELAWPDREQEADRLRMAGYRAMAAALRCYALEIRIKVMICQRLNLNNLPKVCKTHDLKDLIIFTGLWEELIDPSSGAILANWTTILIFNHDNLNSLRYRPASSLAIADADDFDKALDDPVNGVHAWLSKPR